MMKQHVQEETQTKDTGERTGQESNRGNRSHSSSGQRIQQDLSSDWT